ncbi:unnamed protein product [Ectocarpus sp. 4 AP-2014]
MADSISAQNEKCTTPDPASTQPVSKAIRITTTTHTFSLVSHVVSFSRLDKLHGRFLRPWKQLPKLPHFSGEGIGIDTRCAQSLQVRHVSLEWPSLCARAVG